MKYTFSFVLLLIFTTLNVIAQNLQKSEVENPLDCIFYLLSNESSPSRFEIELLASAYSKVGRLKEVARTVELLKNEEEKFTAYLKITEELAKEKQVEPAKVFLLKAFAAARKSQSDDTEKLIKLTAHLAATNFQEQAAEIVANTTDIEGKLEIIAALTNQYLKMGQNEQAQEFLPDALQAARTSGWTDYSVWGIAQVGLFYAKLKQNVKALKLLDEANQIAFSVEDQNRLRDKTLWALIEGFTVVGQPKIAVQIWESHGETKDKYESNKFAELLRNNGYGKEASSIVAQTIAAPSVERLLFNGDIKSALELAKNLSNDCDSYEQQSALLKVADKYLETDEIKAALDVIDFTFQRALKIDVSASELPQQSFGATPDSRKVSYLRRISESYAKANSFNKALLAVDGIHKPNIQATALADLSEKQFKFVQQNKTLSQLARALQIVRTAKDTPLDFQKQNALVRIAEVYAKIGAKEKFLIVFAEALEILVEDYKQDYMLELGIAFEKTKMNPNAKIKKMLQQIIQNEN